MASDNATAVVLALLVPAVATKTEDSPPLLLSPVPAVSCLLPHLCSSPADSKRCMPCAADERSCLPPPVAEDSSSCEEGPGWVAHFEDCIEEEAPVPYISVLVAAAPTMAESTGKEQIKRQNKAADEEQPVMERNGEEAAPIEPPPQVQVLEPCKKPARGTWVKKARVALARKAAGVAHNVRKAGKSCSAGVASAASSTADAVASVVRSVFRHPGRSAHRYQAFKLKSLMACVTPTSTLK
jgi:hypothetical protein